MYRNQSVRTSLASHRQHRKLYNAAMVGNVSLVEYILSQGIHGLKSLYFTVRHDDEIVLYTYLAPTNQSTCLQTCQPVCKPTYLPMYLSTYKPIYLSTYLPNYLTT